MCKMFAGIETRQFKLMFHKQFGLCATLCGGHTTIPKAISSKQEQLPSCRRSSDTVTRMRRSSPRAAWGQLQQHVAGLMFKWECVCQCVCSCLLYVGRRMGVLLITLHALAVSCYSAGPAHGQDRRTMVNTASWIWFRSSVPRSNADWNHFYQASIASIFSINCWSIIEIYNLSKRALNRIQTSAEASSSPQLDVNITDNVILGRGQYLHMDSSSLAWWWH